MKKPIQRFMAFLCGVIITASILTVANYAHDFKEPQKHVTSASQELVFYNYGVDEAQMVTHVFTGYKKPCNFMVFSHVILRKSKRKGLSLAWKCSEHGSSEEFVMSLHKTHWVGTRYFKQDDSKLYSKDQMRFWKSESLAKANRPVKSN
jgi:hypothetical protein